MRTIFLVPAGALVLAGFAVVLGARAIATAATALATELQALGDQRAEIILLVGDLRDLRTRIRAGYREMRHR